MAKVAAAAFAGTEMMRNAAVKTNASPANSVAVAATEKLSNNQPAGNETIPAALAPGNGSRCVAQW